MSVCQVTSQQLQRRLFHEELEQCIVCLSQCRCAHIRSHGAARGGNSPYTPRPAQACGPYSICVPCGQKVVQTISSDRGKHGQFICPVCHKCMGSLRRSFVEGADALRWINHENAAELDDVPLVPACSATQGLVERLGLHMESPQSSVMTPHTSTPRKLRKSISSSVSSRLQAHKPSAGMTPGQSAECCITRTEIVSSFSSSPRGTSSRTRLRRKTSFSMSSRSSLQPTTDLALVEECALSITPASSLGAPRDCLQRRRLSSKTTPSSILTKGFVMDGGSLNCLPSDDLLALSSASLTGCQDIACQISQPGRLTQKEELLNADSTIMQRTHPPSLSPVCPSSEMPAGLKAFGPSIEHASPACSEDLPSSVSGVAYPPAVAVGPSLEGASPALSAQSTCLSVADVYVFPPVSSPVGQAASSSDSASDRSKQRNPGTALSVGSESGLLDDFVLPLGSSVNCCDYIGVLESRVDDVTCSAQTSPSMQPTSSMSQEVAADALGHSIVPHSSFAHRCDATGGPLPPGIPLAAPSVVVTDDSLSGAIVLASPAFQNGSPDDQSDMPVIKSRKPSTRRRAPPKAWQKLWTDDEAPCNRGKRNNPKQGKAEPTCTGSSLISDTCVGKKPTVAAVARTVAKLGKQIADVKAKLPVYLGGEVPTERDHWLGEFPARPFGKDISVLRTYEGPRIKRLRLAAAQGDL